jgi:PAS domain S-box-containing protein
MQYTVGVFGTSVGVQARGNISGGSRGAFESAAPLVQVASLDTALERSETHFRSLIEHASDLVAVLDAAGVVRYASPSHERVLGYLPGDLLGHSAFDLVHPDDRALVVQAFAATAQGRDTATIEFRCLRHDGSWCVLEGKGRNLLGEPAVSGVVVNSRDVTERKRAEEVSSALARVGRELISSLALPVLLERLCRVTAEVLGCDFSYTMFLGEDDRAYVPVAGFGHSQDEWESLRVMSFPVARVPAVHERLCRGEIVPLAVAEHRDVSAALVASAYGMTGVLCMGLHRGGELYGIQTAGYRDRAATFSGEQRRIAEGIAQLASLALENARLVEELDRANRLKSEFVATMSHELRTPLNVIMGYTDMVLDRSFGALSEEQSDMLQRVRASAHTLLDLVTSTLDLSRLETGRVGVELDAVDVSVLASDLIAETLEVLVKPSVCVVADIAPDLPSIQTDVSKLKVVLKNLLSNAAKFTDRGTITLAAHARQGALELTVSDTGIGIAADTIPEVFEPFRQADSSRDRGGVGLGLHIVSRLLDLLGGTVWIDSRLGEGTTVRVTLPERPSP